MHVTTALAVRILPQLRQARRFITARPGRPAGTGVESSKPTDAHIEKSVEGGRVREPRQSSMVRKIKFNDSNSPVVSNERTIPLKVAIARQNIFLKQNYGPLIKKKGVWENLKPRSPLSRPILGELKKGDVQAIRVLQTGYKEIPDGEFTTITATKIRKRPTKIVLAECKPGKLPDDF